MRDLARRPTSCSSRSLPGDGVMGPRLREPARAERGRDHAQHVADGSNGPARPLRRLREHRSGDVGIPVARRLAGPRALRPLRPLQRFRGAALRARHPLRRARSARGDGRGLLHRPRTDRGRRTLPRAADRRLPRDRASCRAQRQPRPGDVAARRVCVRGRSVGGDRRTRRRRRGTDPHRLGSRLEALHLHDLLEAGWLVPDQPARIGGSRRTRSARRRD